MEEGQGWLYDNRVLLDFVFLPFFFLEFFLYFLSTFYLFFLVGVVTEGKEGGRSELSGCWRKISRTGEKGTVRLSE